MNNKINGRIKGCREYELIGHYVIVYYKNGEVNYLADNTLTDWTWTNRLYKAKCYYDSTAAEVKACNIRYNGMHPVDARVKYVTENFKLVEPRRGDRYGRR